jgi:hypothetical protein
MPWRSLMAEGSGDGGPPAARRAFGLFFFALGSHGSGVI